MSVVQPPKDNQATYRLLRTRVVAYSPLAARALGGVKPGILIAQMCYWAADCQGDPDEWFSKDHEEIEEDTALTRREQDSARKELIERGALKAELHGIPPRVYFQVQWTNLINLLAHARESQKEAAHRAGQFGGKRQINLADSAKPSLRKTPHLPLGENVNDREEYIRASRVPTLPGVDIDPVGRTPSTRSARPEAAELFTYYKAHVNEDAILDAARQINARLKVFSVAQLKLAMDHFSADWWSKENNKSRGAEWFFATNKRIEYYLNMKPRTEAEHGRRDEKAGFVGDAARRLDPLTDYGAIGKHDYDPSKYLSAAEYAAEFGDDAVGPP